MKTKKCISKWPSESPHVGRRVTSCDTQDPPCVSKAARQAALVIRPHCPKNITASNFANTRCKFADCVCELDTIRMQSCRLRLQNYSDGRKFIQIYDFQISNTV